MRTGLAVGLTVLLIGGASAQVQVTAAGTLAISYQPSAGGVIQQSQNVTGTATVALAGVATSALAVGAQTTLTVTAISPPFGCWGCWSQAFGDVRVEYSSPTPVAGILRLELAPTCLMYGVFIDVDVDGTFELGFTNPGTQIDVPVVLGLEPLPVRLYAGTVNFGGATCSYPARVTFLPQAANLSTVPAGCGPTVGGALTGAATARRLKVRVGGMTGLIGALAVGGPPVNPTLPCAPAAIPAAAVILVPSPAGAELSIPISAALLGTYTLQYVELSPSNQLVFSNGLVALLP